MIPVKIKGNPYIISTDEAGGAAGPGGLAGACARGQSLFGYPNIIDVSDETNPKIIAKLRLEVSDPANCLKVANETPPDFPGTAPGTNLPAASGTTNYSEERCVADNPNNAKMLACSFSNAGLRVFDIRDPLHAKEIAYWKPGVVRTEVRPSSGSWAFWPKNSSPVAPIKNSLLAPFEDKAGPGGLLPGEIPDILNIYAHCCPVNA